MGAPVSSVAPANPHEPLPPPASLFWIQASSLAKGYVCPPNHEMATPAGGTPIPFVSPHPPTPSPTRGEGEPDNLTSAQSPSPALGEGFRVRAMQVECPLPASGFTDLGFQPDDLGFLDEDGYLHIVGRQSSKIISGGENVYPEPIEQVILSTQLVADVAIAGVPDPEWGQRVTAVYVPLPHPGATPVDSLELETQLQQAIAPQLAPYQRPKQWVRVAQLPRNAQGKLVRSALRQLLPNP